CKLETNIINPANNQKFESLKTCFSVPKSVDICRNVSNEKIQNIHIFETKSTILTIDHDSTSLTSNESITNSDGYDDSIYNYNRRQTSCFFQSADTIQKNVKPEKLINNYSFCCQILIFFWRFMKVSHKLLFFYIFEWKDYKNADDNSFADIVEL
ncbi:hypothetical protein COBT_003160, partial [Conglomerata obtusa]